ncbi:transmembrane protein [Cystoisospora suis]|uniref:Transmembrane protein n=1 Tax=Cystoisospora suis TaxID=483139 RepID=A0A2C6KFP8_9APIC|nr:transmembrane protein [Cystoisospora suis]
MDVNYLQAWVALFQFLAGFLVLPFNSLSILGPQSIPLKDLPISLWNGAKCLFGYNTIISVSLSSCFFFFFFSFSLFSCFFFFFSFSLSIASLLLLLLRTPSLLSSLVSFVSRQPVHTATDFYSIQLKQATKDERSPFILYCAYTHIWI